MTLHLCPMSTYFTDTATYSITICELNVTTHTWRRTTWAAAEKTCVGGCDSDSPPSSEAVKCPLHQQPSWLHLNALPSPQQPEAKLKVFSATQQLSRDVAEQNSTICWTIFTILRISLLQIQDIKWVIINVLYTFCFFKAVRPAGWGTRLKLRRWLLWFHFLVVIRWLGWAGNAKGGNHAISLTGSFTLQSVLWSYTQYQTDWLQPLYNDLFFFACENWWSLWFAFSQLTIC